GRAVSGGNQRRRSGVQRTRLRELYDQIGRQPVSRLGVRVLPKYRTGRAGILPGGPTGRASKRIRRHYRRTDPKEKALLLLLLRRMALSGCQPHTVRILTDVERAGGRFQRIAGSANPGPNLRPADDGRRSRRLQPHSIQRSVARDRSQSAWTQHYSVKSHLRDLEGLSVALARADQFGSPEQLPGVGAGRV